MRSTVKVLPPVVSPFRAVIALHGEHELTDGLGELPHPGVVFLRVLRRGGEQLNDGAERPGGAEDRAPRAFIGSAIPVDGRKVPRQNSGDLLHVAVVVLDEDRALEDHARDGLGDFGLAPSGDGARLVTQGSARPGADQAPRGARDLLLEADEEARRKNVNGSGAEAQAAFAIPVTPGDESFPRMEGGVFGDVIDVRKLPVDGIAFGMLLHQVPEQANGAGIGGLLQADGPVRVEILSEHVGGERESAAGMLLFAAAVQIGREADLRFHLLFAVAEIVVGDEGHHDAAMVAAGHLEGAAGVIRLVVLLPAHTVAALALGRFAETGQPQILLGNAHQVRRQHDAAGVPGPVQGVECRVVFGKVGIPGVSENAFHEIEVADQAGRREEADLHRFFRILAGGGTHQRPQ